ncbi:hypothetical protein FSP39_010636 [Pinctada imbricata]|uniref:Mab-21-like HhH/H2TH-like domain-containing protein n=1 Tax=Pinctada imbricata TaxID=66713 RepID=A0AA89BM24_PINIB|nr:hypothetical protein FSP39_010636 [Pinctada imbricata]
MAESYPYEELCLVSKGLYRYVSDVVGPACTVKLRRQAWELRDTFLSCCTKNDSHGMTSGSIAEGFQFKSSDLDEMGICKDALVLTETASHFSGRLKYAFLFCMETEHVSPGFTLLKCLRFDHRQYMYHFLVNRGSNIYLSSEIVRNASLDAIMSVIHGPCACNVNFGRFEHERATTLKSLAWPKEAQSFISRSHNVGWPSIEVLSDICKDGCLFVPINSKQQSCNEVIDLEWRISFSLAEKKVIHSMNHCQFLCYGLMKIFLNEVLKKIPDTGELLCSYFMKTAVFWEISENNIGWTPGNFIFKFWNVFRRVIGWVSAGYCPNFFMPEHNMFYGKIYGRLQRDLTISLISLFDEGYLCLLRCTSLYKTLSKVVAYPSLVHRISTNEDDYVSLGTIEMYRLFMIVTSISEACFNENVEAMMITILNTASLEPTSNEMLSAIKLRINIVLERLVTVLLSFHGIPHQIPSSNRLKYFFTKNSKTILRRTKTFKFQNKVNYAVISYKNGNYLELIQIVKHIKQRLQWEYYMYMAHGDADVVIEWRRQGIPLEAILKNFVIEAYKYEPSISVEDLTLESDVKKYLHGCGCLQIPTLVFLNFMLILNSARVNDILTMNEILHELKTLVQFDDCYHIFFLIRAISWEILGICQQLCGDLNGAYQSYVNALIDECTDFKEATVFRIKSLNL